MKHLPFVLFCALVLYISGCSYVYAESGDCSATWTSTIHITSCSNGGISKSQYFTIRWSDGRTTMTQNNGEGSCCTGYISSWECWPQFYQPTVLSLPSGDNGRAEWSQSVYDNRCDFDDSSGCRTVTFARTVDESHECGTQGFLDQ